MGDNVVNGVQTQLSVFEPRFTYRSPIKESPLVITKKDNRTEKLAQNGQKILCMDDHNLLIYLTHWMARWDCNGCTNTIYPSLLALVS